MSQTVISQLRSMREQASPVEARYLYDNLLNLLAHQYSNKMSPIVKAVQKNKPERLLDIGCGYGALALFFAMQGISVTGIDLREDGIEACTRLAGVLGIQNITLMPMNACAISLSGFDMAVSTDFYEHLSYEDQPEHLRSVWKALKPGGTYVIRAPHRSDINQQHREEHIGLPSFRRVQEQASEAGFTVRFGIAHTGIVSPFTYHIALEQWLESRNWDALTLYKRLRRAGLANVVAHLEKPAHSSTTMP